MKMRRLGKTGYEVTEIGLGCWQLGGDFGPMDDEEAGAILANAARLGVTFWDTADVYGAGLSEHRIGTYYGKPDGLIIATKVGRSGALYPDKYTRSGVRENLEESARRLCVETLDLVQLHCVPPQVLKDGEIFAWLEDFKSEGLIRHYGASVETIEEAFICLEHDGLATLQIIFNLFRQDANKELFEAATTKDVGIIVRLPLASGLLSGKFTKDTEFQPTDHRSYNRDGEAFSVGETFGGISFEKGVELVEGLRQTIPGSMSMADFALRWILDHPAVSTVIAGVSRPEQISANVEAASVLPLDAEIHAKVAAYYENEVRPHIRGKI
ncbi:aldo/keto reductase [Pelagibacterium xiamenense]|uniref:aldo/keto reductase n=1 Tax=Pelagibacterium xiamenense TaxID=2901140 RepID=UPI001E5DF2F0|nr:aldo/keto reductase [Pelagibacterium xiamenense]MCD7058803.1 aldo/keto reductase [Pelagibacterium xiamenense]